MRYRDRVEAGRRLAAALLDADAVAPEEPVVVLGVPRGGVPVAAEVAAALGAPLDVLLAHKLGAPSNPEFAIGAVAEDGAVLVDRSLLRRLGIPETYVVEEQRRRLAEARRRAETYREGREPVPVRGRTCVVVDDGVATGSTLEAALRLVRSRGATRIVAAVPVGPPDTIRRLESVADLVVCPLQPAGFGAVGAWYDRFDQVSDAEVIDALRRG